MSRADVMLFWESTRRSAPPEGGVPILSKVKVTKGAGKSFGLVEGSEAS